MSTPRVQVIERAIDILNALGRGRGTLSEITREVGLPKGTTFRILGSLQYEHLVVKDPVDGSYQLGPGFLRLSQAQTPWFAPLAVLARSAMEQLLAASGETVALHVRVGPERICIAELPSPQQIRYSADLGVAIPLHVGAAGKVLLAELGATEFERILGALELNSITDETLSSRDALIAEVTRTRERGYAQSVGERVTGAAAISVPVFLESGSGAVLSLLGPDNRFTEELRLAQLEALKGASAQITAAAQFSS